MADIQIDEAIPRHVEENPYNYTTIEKAERSKALKDMAKDYPKLPFSWVEMVYDFWKHTPKETFEDIINKGLWEKAGKFSDAKGGVLHNMEILEKGLDENVLITENKITA